MNLIHTGLNKLIRKSLKREMSDYEVEKLKAITVVVICIILSVVLFIIDPMDAGGIEFGNLIGYLIFGFIPMVFLYALSFFIKVIFSGGSNGTKIGLLSLTLRGNTVLWLIGITLDVLIFCVLIIVGLIVGIPVSGYNIHRRLQMCK